MDTDFDRAREFLTGEGRPFEPSHAGCPVVSLWEFPSFSNWLSFDVVVTQPATVCRISAWEYLRDCERAAAFGMIGNIPPPLSLLRLPWRSLHEAGSTVLADVLDKFRLFPSLARDYGADGVSYGVRVGAVGETPIYEAVLWGGGWKDTLNPPEYLRRRPGREPALRSLGVCGSLWATLIGAFQVNES